MTDRLRTATKLNLRPETRLALEALALDLGCSMVQAVERLLTLPHSQLVALCKADQPAATDVAPVPQYSYGADGSVIMLNHEEVTRASLAKAEAALCIHTLNNLGNCTRCGARPNDKLTASPTTAGMPAPKPR